jgi:Mycotoxin biosynthesis protein UstYa
MTEDEKQREGPHIDHCLEYWREAAMCRADMALSTFYWNKPVLSPPAACTQITNASTGSASTPGRGPAWSSSRTRATLKIRATMANAGR